MGLIFLPVTSEKCVFTVGCHFDKIRIVCDIERKQIREITLKDAIMAGFTGARVFQDWIMHNHAYTLLDYGWFVSVDEAKK